MNRNHKSIGKIGFLCLWISLMMVILAGCGIHIGTSNSSIEISEESLDKNSEDESDPISEEGTASPSDEGESISKDLSQESEYVSILDFIPEHKKHFLQKKDRLTAKNDSEEENSGEESSAADSKEESEDSEDSEEESQEESGEESSEIPKDDTIKTKYLVRINKTTNVLTVYVKDGAGNYSVPVKSMLCSTGKSTPIGTFMMGYQSRWKGLVGGQWAQCVSHISGDFLIQSVPYRKKSSDSMIVSSYNALGNSSTPGSIFLCAADAYWIYMNCEAYNTTIQIGFFGTSDPWGKPSMIKLPATQTINWDPSDPADGNPWNTKLPYFTGVQDYTIYVGESTPDLMRNVRGFDTCGNEQTSLIRVSGSVNGYVPGTYTVTYYLTDVLGRTGVQKAYVTVKAKPESSRPESSRPESSRPESSRPESSRPESTRPESSRPESSTPESSIPESSRPESSEPDYSQPESSDPEYSKPESSDPGSSVPEESKPEDSVPDSSMEDRSEEDSGPIESSEESSGPQQEEIEFSKEESAPVESIIERSSEPESIETSGSEYSESEKTESSEIQPE